MPNIDKKGIITKAIKAFNDNGNNVNNNNNNGDINKQIENIVNKNEENIFSKINAIIDYHKVKGDINNNLNDLQKDILKCAINIKAIFSDNKDSINSAIENFDTFQYQFNNYVDSFTTLLQLLNDADLNESEIKYILKAYLHLESFCLFVLTHLKAALSKDFLENVSKK